MAICRGCGGVFQWGRAGDAWVLLQPVGADEDMDRSYVDENGVLRADHRDACPAAGGVTINVTRLGKKIPAGDVIKRGARRGKRRAA